MRYRETKHVSLYLMTAHPRSRSQDPVILGRMVPAPEGSSLLLRALSDSVEQVDDTEEFSTRILDAAADLFARVGIPRVTMDEVARSAGVARITIYRRFASKDVLVEQV